MGKVVPIILKISGPDRGPDCNIFQPSNILSGSN